MEPALQLACRPGNQGLQTGFKGGNMSSQCKAKGDNVIHGCINKEAVSRSGELILSLPAALVSLTLAQRKKFWCLYFKWGKLETGQREDERKCLSLVKAWKGSLCLAYQKDGDVT